MTNPFNQQTAIPGVKRIIAVSSGKGGVGKSTVAGNLALGLARLGAKVGLLDADIYGPSVPRMFGLLHQKPEVTPQQRIIPLTRFGMKLMSIGFLVEEDLAVVWRGPMLFKAVDQFLRDVDWGELDYLIIDLPPGTGDIQLSLAQKVPLSGAVLVSTPQNLALVDVKKAYDMWKRVGVPVLGYIENMSYFVAPGTSEKMQLFPKGDLGPFFQRHSIKHLGEIPFHPHVGLSSEMGIPVVESHPKSEEAQAFLRIAELLHQMETTAPAPHAPA